MVIQIARQFLRHWQRKQTVSRTAWPACLSGRTAQTLSTSP